MRQVIPWLVALLAVIGCGAMAYRDHEEKLRIVVLESKLQGLESDSRRQVLELERKITKAETARAAAEKKLRTAAEAKQGGSTSPRRRRGPLDMDEMRKDPGYAALWRKQQLRNINRTYGDVLLKLNLPADELAKVKDLLIAREDAVADAREAAQEAGMDNQTVNKAASQAMNEVNGEITALVGADDFGQIQSAQQTGGYKMMIQMQVGVDLTAAGIPLSPQQADALAQIYVKTQGLGVMRGAVDPQSGLTAGQQSIIDQAAQVLAPAQLPYFHDYLVEQTQQQQYFRNYMASHRP